MKLNICVLICGEPIENVKKVKGHYGNFFKGWIGEEKELIEKENLELNYSFFECYNEKFPSDPICESQDVFIISGSRFSVTDLTEKWKNDLIELIKNVHKMNKLILGICFGHQMVARAFNGTVVQNKKGWEVSVIDQELNKVGKQFFEKFGEKIEENGNFKICQFHRDIVETLPEKFEPMSSSSLTTFQSFISDDQKIVCFQGHPEFDSFVLSVLFNERRELLGEKIADDGKEKMNRSTDRGVLARAVLRWIIQNKKN